MELVKSRREVIQNLYQLYSYINNKEEPGMDFLKGLLINGKVFVVEKVAGVLLYGPSKFCGYKENSEQGYLINKKQGADGRDSNNALSLIYKDEKPNDFLLNEFKKHLNELGIKRNFAEKPIRFYYNDRNISRKDFNCYFISPTHVPGAKYNAWKSFLDKNIASIGWNFGDYTDWEWNDVVTKIEEQGYPNGDKAIKSHENFSKIEEGDLICCTDNNRGLFGIGIIASKRKYKPNIHNAGSEDQSEGYAHYVDVEWIKKEYIVQNDIPNKKESLWQPFGTLQKRNPIPNYILQLIFRNKIESVQNSKKNNDMSALNTILYGPPGTGKTYHTIQRSVEIINPEFDFKNSTRDQLKKEYERLSDEGRIHFVTFHQSMSYEDFIEGLKPVLINEETGNLGYTIEDGIFKRICKEAMKTETKSIVIDKQKVELTEDVFTDLYNNFVETLNPVTEDESNCELTTPNGSKFGLYKNLAGSISVKSGYQKTKLSVSLNQLNKVVFEKKMPTYVSYEPKIIEKLLEGIDYEEEKVEEEKKFVLIIDEINRGNISQIFGELITLIEPDKRKNATEELSVILPYSNKSFSVPNNLHLIGTMNTADRSVEALDTALRRRFSFKFMPPDVENVSDFNIDEISLKEIFVQINERIAFLLDSDHQIGHSYFMKIQDEDHLKDIFKNKIIPLLKEYFYNDYRKIHLVLGDGFVEKSENKKPSFAVKNDDELERDSYKIIAIDQSFNITNALRKTYAE